MRDVLAGVWAKSAPGGGDGETLSAHTGHVLARLAGWRDRFPDLARTLHRPDLWNVAGWACALHDIGKVARGFQAMVRGGTRFDHRHEILSLVAVGWLDVDDEVVELVAGGVATHHKDLREILLVRYPADLPEERTELLRELDPEAALRVREWLDGGGAPDLEHFGFAPLPALLGTSAPASFGRAMRLLSKLRDEVENPSRTAIEPLCLAGTGIRGLLLLADHAGSAHASLGRVEVLSSPASFRQGALGSLVGSLYAHQEACAGADGHVILRAPTGSGKTEAALLWAARQREASAQPRTLFYVLPYRASLNAMRARLPEYGIPDSSIVLQHASATAALYRHLLESKGYQSADAAREARRESNLGRLMTAPVRVLTPYQLLKGFFGLRGHEAILTDAAGGLFVLDELHAYDTGRVAMILASLQHLVCQLGARVMAMSATLPEALRSVLCRLLDTTPVEVRADAKTLASFRRHMLHLVRGDLLDGDTLAAVRSRYEAGEAVLVVATTVARAQRIFDSLRARIPRGDVHLLHGRFTREDRAAKEIRLRDRLGTRTRDRSSGATVLVATQVVEVSLDVDFDVLFTDPAPVEALLQRFGRVNRARRGGLRDVFVHASVPDEGRAIYAPLRVARALEILSANHGQPILEERVQEWVDAEYAPERAAFEATLLKDVARFRVDVIAANRPFESHPELEAAFDDLFDGTEVVPASLSDRYERLLDSDPLEATFLHVPISSGQRRRLKAEGRLDGVVARVPYDPERGLDLRCDDDA